MTGRVGGWEAQKMKRDRQRVRISDENDERVGWRRIRHHVLGRESAQERARESESETDRQQA